MKQTISVIVTDLDNTLFDWLDIWYRPFNAMIESLVTQSGKTRDILERDCKRVHEKYGTSEYAFLVEELQCLQEMHPGQNPRLVYSASIDAYRRERAAAMHLYPTVRETLETLKDQGCLLVGYTESMAFYSNYRVHALGLDRLLDYLYSPPDHDLPEGRTRHAAADAPFRRTLQRHTPRGELKPNPKLLADILRDIGARREETLYVGDNLMKDIAMAKEADITDAYAKYGGTQGRPEYGALKRVTHWPTAHVKKEEATTIEPTYVLNSFGEIVNLFHFERFVDRSETKAKTVLETWKQTIAVQQHFNDLELRIRNYAVTVLVAVIATTVAFLRGRTDVQIAGWRLPAASLVLVGGLIAWVAFYFMDRFWYHMLLYGSVGHGRFIERRWEPYAPELGLTEAISRASPLQVGPFTIHSTRKIDLFYGTVAVALGLLILAVAYSRPSGGAEEAPPACATVVSTPPRPGKTQPAPSEQPRAATPPGTTTREPQAAIR